jgi:hypothetical protein
MLKGAFKDLRRQVIGQLGIQDADPHIVIDTVEVAVVKGDESQPVLGGSHRQDRFFPHLPIEIHNVLRSAF